MRYRGLANALLAAAAGCGAAAATGAPSGPDFGSAPASSEVRVTAQWVLAVSDHQRRPFAVVDKREARIYVFDAAGRLQGASAALLGSARGEVPAPDMARRTPASLAPAERTTPAGRFASEPGHNDKGEAIVWFDYDAALAVHRLRPGPAGERRAQRLASPSPDDNRITLGCVVVPEAFYDEVVAPLLGRRHGVVYMLPEAGSAQALFAQARWD